MSTLEWWANRRRAAAEAERLHVCGEEALRRDSWRPPFGPRSDEEQFADKSGVFVLITEVEMMTVIWVFRHIGTSWVVHCIGRMVHCIAKVVQLTGDRAAESAGRRPKKLLT